MTIISELKRYRFVLDEKMNFIIYDKLTGRWADIAKNNFYSLQSAIARAQNKRRIIEKKAIREGGRRENQRKPNIRD